MGDWRWRWLGRRWWSRVARERLLGSAPGSGGELLEVRENVTVLREGCGMLELMEKRGLDNSRYGWRGRGRRGGAWAWMLEWRGWMSQGNVLEV